MKNVSNEYLCIHELPRFIINVLQGAGSLLILIGNPYTYPIYFNQVVSNTHKIMMNMGMEAKRTIDMMKREINNWQGDPINHEKNLDLLCQSGWVSLTLWMNSFPRNRTKYE